MKKVIATILAGLAMTACTAKQVTDYSHIYSKMTIITAIYEDEDTVVCEDFSGELWMFQGIEDLCEGEIVTLTMDDNGTKVIYDDRVINAHYDGWIAGWQERGF